MKKVVLKLSVHDDKDKQKAMKTVSGLAGIDSIAVDLKESKMTVIGEVDPVQVVSKLRKLWCAEIDTVGPAKEEKKGDKKDEKKDDKKDDKEKIDELIKLYKQHQICTPYYYAQSVEENPNSCAIC